MQLFERADQEILEIANPISDNLIEGSNEMDYQKTSKGFSTRMLEAADENNLKKQWETSDVRTKEKVQGQWRLYCVIHDIEKLANYGNLSR